MQTWLTLSEGQVGALPSLFSPEPRLMEYHLSLEKERGLWKVSPKLLNALA